MNILHKIVKSLSIIRHRKEICRKATYYPECDRKSNGVIISDQLFLLWKYGEIEPFYFTYGFDRKEMSRERMTEEYILPYHRFEKRINHLNFQNPRYDVFRGKFTGRVITGDKFYFNVFLERFGIPTPKVYLFVKDKTILYINPNFHIETSFPIEMQLKQFFSQDMEAFAKPSDGQLGNGVFSLIIKGGRVFVNNKETTVDKLIPIILSADYLVQECVHQHPKMSELCSSCINSIRLQTVMDKNGIVHPFGAGLRIGRKGSSIDNWAKGGVFVGIDVNGKLMERGYLKPIFGTSMREHPDTHVVFKNFEIPYYHEAEILAVKLHKYLYRCHSVGWDIAVTEKGPVFIEGNGLWEISLLQAVHGGLKKEIEKYF
jgi:hypothetical protein